MTVDSVLDQVLAGASYPSTMLNFSLAPKATTSPVCFRLPMS